MRIKQLWTITLAMAILSKGLVGAPTITLSHNTVWPGDTLKAEISSEKRIKKARAKFGKKYFHFFERFPERDAPPYIYTAYIGISRKLQKKKTRPLYVNVTFSDNSKHSSRFKLFVQKTRFRREYINLSRRSSKLQRSTDVLVSENRLLSLYLVERDPDRRFRRSFIFPVESGRRTSPFGNTRVYNGRPSWAHSGMDIGKHKGAEIMAANDGLITLAANLRVHGKTLLIDHGWGVISIYNHLDEIFVQEGQMVRRGEVVGTMGSTGIATGPHLHWGLSVQNERVDPQQWLDREWLYD